MFICHIHKKAHFKSVPVCILFFCFPSGGVSQVLFMHLLLHLLEHLLHPLQLQMRRAEERCSLCKNTQLIVPQHRWGYIKPPPPVIHYLSRGRPPPTHFIIFHLDEFLRLCVRCGDLQQWDGAFHPLVGVHLTGRQVQRTSRDNHVAPTTPPRHLMKISVFYSYHSFLSDWVCMWTKMNTSLVKKLVVLTCLLIIFQ